MRPIIFLLLSSTLFLSSTLLFSSTTKAQLHYCSGNRSNVKALCDPDAALIHAGFVSSIAHESSLDRPYLTRATPRLDSERVIVTLYATITNYKVEDDESIRLVLADSGRNTMLADLPNSESEQSRLSAHQSDYRNSRKWIEQNLDEPAQEYKACNQKVKITGVRYFGFKHRQFGVSLNGVKIYPILAISSVPDNSVPNESVSNSGDPKGTTVSTSMSGASMSGTSMLSTSMSGASMLSAPMSMDTPEQNRQ